jgi:probable F420-dependent oxidoreductase
MSAADERAFVQAVEAAGYGALWVPEGGQSKEIFSHAAVLLGATQRLLIASGIANIWARDPQSMMNGAQTLHEAFDGRFTLGLGVSHAPAVKRRGGVYERPMQAMRAYLDGMEAAPWAAPKSATPVPSVLAALGPQMLRLAANRSLGAHPYFVPVEHTPIARAALGPGPLLAVEQAAVLATDPVVARHAARVHMARYLTLENYTNNLRRLGWADEDLRDGGSDRLVDAIVVWGDEAAIRQRVRAHLDGGADHVCLQMLEGEGVPAAQEQLQGLAPALGLNPTVG